MPPTPNPSGYRAATVLCATLLGLLAVGCASPGPPRPPSLELPQSVTDLTAQRIGDQVVLHWTTPSKSTENLLLPDKVASHLTARICRTPAAAPVVVPATPCTPILDVPIQPGPSTVASALTGGLAGDPVTLLDYRVEIANPAGRTAGPSNSALTVAGAAPPPVENLRATPIPTGTMLEWQPATTSASVDTVEIDRILNVTKPVLPEVIPAAPSVPAPAKRKVGSKTASTPFKGKPARPIQPAGQQVFEVHLRATPTPAADSGGTLDQTARFGESYTYTAQRVRSVKLGTSTYEIRSPLSAPVTLALRDTFPPAPPRGLDGIPTQTPVPAIDLSWEPNTEPDLAGYLVYRQLLDDSGAATGPPLRITPKPLPGPAYSDTKAIVGQHYMYSVTAIDNSGNESKPSPEIEETLR